jgi:CRP-like cAMP-binding protein
LGPRLSHFFCYPTGEHDHEHDEQRHFLADCTSHDWHLISEHAKARRFDTGVVVLAPGHLERALYFVVAGTLEVRPTGARGRTRPFTIDAGAVFGEMGFLDGRVNDATIRALSPVEVLHLTLVDFEALAAKNPTLGRYVLFDLARLLARRVHDLQVLLPRARRSP